MDAPVQKSREAAQLQVVSVQQHWMALLPPPEIMRHYNEIVPNAAERILAMAEKEAAARHANDASAMANDTLHLETARDDARAYRKEVRAGQAFTFIVVMLTITASVICAYIGQPWVAGVLGGSTLISVVNAMLNAKGKSK